LTTPATITMDERASKLFSELYREGDTFVDTIRRFQDKNFDENEEDSLALYTCFARLMYRFAKKNPSFRDSYCLRFEKNIAEKYPSRTLTDKIKGVFSKKNRKIKID